MVFRKVTIAVDDKFFKNIFEKERKQQQTKLGVINLSQTNFTKMITGFKLKPLKMDFNKIKKGGKIKNEYFKI